MNLSKAELHDFLETKYNQYNNPDFIKTDPIQIPHAFAKQSDIEISAFITATIAWGKREMIIRNANKITQAMGNSPYEFTVNYSDNDFKYIANTGHRTFKPEDLHFFLKALQDIYLNHGGLQKIFYQGFQETQNIFDTITLFRDIFLETPHQQRSEKHIANPKKNSAAKRINMFLMWMVRNDKRGVHFGLWDKIPTSALIIPMDVHCGNTARMLNLITRKQNDRKSATQLTENLKEFDPNDPVKYDFALFGTGIFENFPN